jgi:hypothetical protein
MSAKLYCYVDETGQDTHGRLFLVAVVVTGEEREQLRGLCEALEGRSRKGRRKWSKTSAERRIAYARGVVDQPLFAGKLHYAIFEGITDYLTATVQAIAETLQAETAEDYDATVFIDGLSRSLERAVGLSLRRSGSHVKKVRGLDEENDALMRLADAVCGLVRGALEGESALMALCQRGREAGILCDIPQK